MRRLPLADKRPLTAMMDFLDATASLVAPIAAGCGILASTAKFTNESTPWCLSVLAFIAFMHGAIVIALMFAMRRGGESRPRLSSIALLLGDARAVPVSVVLLVAMLSNPSLP